MEDCLDEDEIEGSVHDGSNNIAEEESEYGKPTEEAAQYEADIVPFNRHRHEVIVGFSSHCEFKRLVDSDIEERGGV